MKFNPLKKSQNFISNLLAASLFAAALTACSDARDIAAPVAEPMTQNQMAEAEAEAEAAAAGISISDPYILPPLPGRDVAAGFFKLKNTGVPDRLISASSPASKAVEIHNHIKDNGVMRMRRIDGLDLPKNSQINFEPGSHHLMFFGTDFHSRQSEIVVTLQYEKSGTVSVTMPIRQRGDKPVPAKGSGSDYGSDNGESSGSATGSGTAFGTDRGNGGKAEMPNEKQGYGSGH